MHAGHLWSISVLALFAGIYVSDHAAAKEWSAGLLGKEPSFIPNDTEAVWGLFGFQRGVMASRRSQLGRPA
jgi:hypothetical protein